ncbi:hypothetical protein EDC01DRAFT_262928 [Geopyxis carbonaria]|nr:hypothetical protein EDC01DRAFT_262928 [Geopyxis carbonaria]
MGTCTATAGGDGGGADIEQRLRRYIRYLLTSHPTSRPVSPPISPPQHPSQHPPHRTPHRTLQTQHNTTPHPTPPHPTPQHFYIPSQPSTHLQPTFQNDFQPDYPRNSIDRQAGIGELQRVDAAVAVWYGAGVEVWRTLKLGHATRTSSRRYRVPNVKYQYSILDIRTCKETFRTLHHTHPLLQHEHTVFYPFSHPFHTPLLSHTFSHLFHTLFTTHILTFSHAVLRPVSTMQKRSYTYNIKE